jgi:hypothetical protein
VVETMDTAKPRDLPFNPMKVGCAEVFMMEDPSEAIVNELLPIKGRRERPELARRNNLCQLLQRGDTGIHVPRSAGSDLLSTRPTLLRLPLTHHWQGRCPRRITQIAPNPTVPPWG